MKDFRRGTPAFGVVTGLLFVLVAGLIMWLGFWRVLLLAALFAAGYLLGGVEDIGRFFRTTVDRVVPGKEQESIDFRKEVEQEQETYDFRKEVEAEQAARDFRAERENLFPKAEADGADGASEQKDGEEA